MCYMWPDLGKSNILHIPSKLRFCSIYNVNYKFAKYEHLQFYCQWATALCNAAITIANIEGGKLACAHTQNGTLCNMLGFRTSHIIMVYMYFLMNMHDVSSYELSLIVHANIVIFCLPRVVPVAGRLLCSNCSSGCVQRQAPQSCAHQWIYSWTGHYGGDFVCFFFCNCFGANYWLHIILDIFFIEQGLSRMGIQRAPPPPPPPFLSTRTIKSTGGADTW